MVKFFAFSITDEVDFIVTVICLEQLYVHKSSPKNVIIIHKKIQCRGPERGPGRNPEKGLHRGSERDEDSESKKSLREVHIGVIKLDKLYNVCRGLKWSPKGVPDGRGWPC